MATFLKFEWRIFLLLSIIGLFGIVTLALAAATLGTLNSKFNAINTNAVTSKPILDSALAETIRIDDLMAHLRQLQRIADESNGTRAINTRGFNETVNYIYTYLTEQVPDLKVMRESFPVRDFALQTDPVLISSINGTERNFTYSSNLARSEFTYVTYSAAANSTEFTRVVPIANFACRASEWQNVTNLVALVRSGGPCTFAEKGILAGNSGAKALLFYNDDASSTNLGPISVRVRQTNVLPALFLSYDAGNALLNATSSATVMVKLTIELKNLPSFPVENICADTMTGDVSQTIVVGSHTDSVPAGPGINDNGKYCDLLLLTETNGEISFR